MEREELRNEIVKIATTISLTKDIDIREKLKKKLDNLIDMALKNNKI